MNGNVLYHSLLELASGDRFGARLRKWGASVEWPAWEFAGSMFELPTIHSGPSAERDYGLTSAVRSAAGLRRCRRTRAQ
jgi:hypothetical protein